MSPQEERQRHAEAIRTKGIAGFQMSPEEARSPLWQRFEAALREERAITREHLEYPQNIEQTTLLRGQLQLVKQILARTDEVGPESRQSEPAWPESAFRPSATGMPPGY